MVNQLSKSTEHLADKTKPLRDLLIKKSSWTLGNAQESAFRKTKECLISQISNRKIKVFSDASKYGTGGVVLQEKMMDFGNQLHIFQECSQMWSHIIHQLRKKLLGLLGNVSMQVTTFLESP